MTVFRPRDLECKECVHWARVDVISFDTSDLSSYRYYRGVFNMIVRGYLVRVLGSFLVPRNFLNNSQFLLENCALFISDELRKFTISDFPKQTHFGHILITLFFFFTL